MAGVDHARNGFDRGVDLLRGDGQRLGVGMEHPDLDGRVNRRSLGQLLGDEFDFRQPGQGECPDAFDDAQIAIQTRGLDHQPPPARVARGIGNVVVEPRAAVADEAVHCLHVRVGAQGLFQHRGNAERVGQCRALGQGEIHDDLIAIGIRKELRIDPARHEERQTDE